MQQQSTGSMKNMTTEKRNTVTDKELSIKLLIDSKANKILFAEAEKKFIDFLFGLLAMPLGTVIELITEENMMGSMGNLYKSVKNISEIHILGKNSILLKPEVVLICAGRRASSGYNYVMKLLGRKCASSNNQIAGGVSNGLSVMPVSTTSRIKIINAGDATSLTKRTVSFGIKEGLEVLWAALRSTTVLSEVFLEKIINPEMNSGHNLVTKLLESSSPSCCNQKNVGFISITGTTDDGASKQVDGFVQGGSVKELVTDELVVVPMTNSSRMSVFEKLNVVDISALKEKTVNFGIKEGLEVLKTALQSKTVLTYSKIDAVQRPGKPEIIVLD
ncbi:hypothetical protein FRX31_009990 [Thalictrum thalictroides]|uniref:Uncharacterized protein n=1 Tax=Thalictrum thalictroides TaxID=46969 RepID=A0A7J6WUL8_THATH|nr:hypothetical protein FRX31_009990 [Thalictrum thalictroides]